jgi:short-subunit dehydrogenase
MLPPLGTALITGASTGIGATYADRLARRGYDLILVARNQQNLETLARRLRAEAGIIVEVMRADLTDASSLKQVERRVCTDPKPAMLVNNAGIAGPALLGEDPEVIESLLLLNVVAATRLACAAAAVFVERKTGTIINMSSVAALLPEYFAGPYSGTKAYLLAFSQALQRETSPAGVHVQVVLPGATRTEIWERSRLDLSQFDPRMIMEGDEMVDAALAGLDNGEHVTCPSLPDWQTGMRLAPPASVCCRTCRANMRPSATGVPAVHSSTKMHDMSIRQDFPRIGTRHREPL